MMLSLIYTENIYNTHYLEKIKIILGIHLEQIYNAVIDIYWNYLQCTSFKKIEFTVEALP